MNELDRLRRRAYGPDADNAGDATAQARLPRLETPRRRHLTPGVGVAAGVRAPIPDRARVLEHVPGLTRFVFKGDHVKLYVSEAALDEA
jgi:hypothetical protein